MIPHWLRRQNLREVMAYARTIDARAGTVHAFERPDGVCYRLVPANVHAYTMRLRLWAADVANGLRP